MYERRLLLFSVGIRRQGDRLDRDLAASLDCAIADGWHEFPISCHRSRRRFGCGSRDGIEGVGRSFSDSMADIGGLRSRVMGGGSLFRIGYRPPPLAKRRTIVRAWRVSLLAGGAASICFGLFDLLVQRWGPDWGMGRLLPCIFGINAIFTLVLGMIFPLSWKSMPQGAWKWTLSGAFFIELTEYFVRELFSDLWTCDVVEHHLFFARIDEFVLGADAWPLVL